MQNVVSTCWVASAALFGILATLSNPDYYVWVIVPLLFMVVAYRSFIVPSNKRILVVGCAAIGLYAFVVGRTMFEAHRLTDAGVFVAFLATIPAGYLMWRFYKTESAAA